jgi:hypothetical protein
MLSSARRINYSLRPAKQIERKMLCEAFRALTLFAPIQAYQYIGMGALQFADFIMIHRELGITRMFSIEGDPHRERFTFNKPYESVQMLFGLSTDVLRRDVDWSVPSIVWLDYDRRVVPSVLDDIELFLRRALPGSVLLVTVDAELEHIRRGEDPAKTEAEAETEGAIESETSAPLDILRDEFPIAAALADESDPTFVGWQVAAAYAGLIADAIQEIQVQEQRDDRGVYRQLFHFQYADTARMLTIGGLLVAPEKLAEATATWSTDNYPYIRFEGMQPYQIDLPRLTYREAQFLNQFLPGSNGAEPVPEEDRKRYAGLYRWFPTFAEIEL